jgi:beta-galactosidase
MTPKLGVCYYPEHWPEAQWAEDAARMAETGLTWVRIGEFAWSRLEPKPGQLEFDWLDRAIDTLGNAGLQVILGTPTATPPRWMLDRHPDMLARDENGHERKFGSRRHYCFSHQGYREECRRIATLLGERYGHHPHVQAWQIDNEYGCHDTTLSYSDAARRGFQDWLAQKYHSPDALNRAWGTVFWSMEDSDWSEIELPNLTVTEANPSHILDFRRFSSDQVVAFNKVQTDVLRPLTDRPLIHNYMGSVRGATDFDHFAVGADLDIASWDSYPLGFLLDRVHGADNAHKDRYLRQGDPDFQAFNHDLYRAVGRGRWWVMEQQPGPVNWAPWNPAPLPGMARLWAWEAIAHGAEAVCYFRWRQAPFAQEQYHAGLLRPDSVATATLEEAAQVASELGEIGDVELAQAPVALIFDYEAVWVTETQPQGQDYSSYGLALDAYRALRRAGFSMDVVAPDADLSGYKMVFAPGLSIISDALKQKLAETEAVTVVGPRSGAKTANDAIPVPLPPGLPGLDAVVAQVESLPPGSQVPWANGRGSFLRWFEHLESTAEPAVRTEGGLPVLVGQGKLSYLAGWPDRDGWDLVVSQAASAAGLDVLSLPEGLRMREAGDHRFMFNYGPEPVEWEGETIEVAGVRWLRRS